MKVLIVLFVVAFVCHISAKSIGDKVEPAPAEVPQNEEVIVASSLNVKSKEPNSRAKRQFGGGFGQSSGQANANAYNQYAGPGGFGANNANAGAQSFQSQGPLGGFGASAANSGSQGFHAGPGGIQGSANQAGTQTYNLPGGHSIGVAYGGGFSHNNGQATGSNSNSVTYTK